MGLPRIQIKRPGDVIAQVGQQVGGFIANIPQMKRQADEQRRQDEQFEAAAEQAKRDWGLMETAWSGIKQAMKNSGQKAIDAGNFTQEELQGFVDRLRQPVQGDKKDGGIAYMKEMKAAWNDFDKALKDREGKAQAAQQQEATTKAISGSPAIPGQSLVPGDAPIPPSIEPPETPQGLRQAEALPPEVTGGQVGQLPTPGTPAVPRAQFQEEAFERIPPEKRGAFQQFKEGGGEALPTKFQLRKQEEVERRNRQMAANKFTSGQKDKALKTLTFLEKKSSLNASQETRALTEKRQLSSLLSKAMKKEPLEELQLQALEEQGLDTSVITAGGEELETAIRELITKQNKKLVLIKKQGREIQNSIIEFETNPEATLPDVLAFGRETTFPDVDPGSQLSPPPALGGTPQIGRKENVVSAIGITADKTKVKLSDGTMITVEEAQQRRLVE